MSDLAMMIATAVFIVLVVGAVCYSILVRRRRRSSDGPPENGQD